MVIYSLLHISVAVYTVNHQHLKWKVTTEKRRKAVTAVKNVKKGVLSMDTILEDSKPGETRKEVA